jgi:hypothetical protein
MASIFTQVNKIHNWTNFHPPDSTSIVKVLCWETVHLIGYSFLPRAQPCAASLATALLIFSTTYSTFDNIFFSATILRGAYLDVYDDQ